MKRPPFNIAEVDEARALAAQGLAIHREADDEPDMDKRVSLRRAACRLEQRADEIVPVEYR